MKNIMKPITIAVGDIIGKWIPNEYAIPLKIALAASALIDPNFELSGKLLFDSEGVIEIQAHQINRLWLQECAPSLPKIPSCNIRKSQLGCVDRIKIGPRESY